MFLRIEEAERAAPRKGASRCSTVCLVVAMHGVQSDGESNGDPNKVEATLACLCFFGLGRGQEQSASRFFENVAPGERVGPLASGLVQNVLERDQQLRDVCIPVRDPIYRDIKISYRYSFRYMYR